MGHWAFESFGVGGDLLRELTFKAGEHIIEGQRVRGEVDPARVGSEDSQGLTGPQTVRLAPESSVGVELLGVLVEGIHVVFPHKCAAFNIKVFLEDARPLGTGNVLIDLTQSLGAIHGAQLHVGSELDVGGELLPGLVVAVVNGTALVLDDTGESIEVCGSGGCGDLSSETVTADGGHREPVFIHPADDVVAHFLNDNVWLEILSAYLPPYRRKRGDRTCPSSCS